MFTRCPHCQTVFRVSEDQLQAADGDVRCGNCRAVFSGRTHLIESPGAPAEAGGPTPTHAQPSERRPPHAPHAPVPEMLVDDLAAAARPRSIWSAVGWTATVAGLMVLLVGQILFFMPDELVRYPALRPAVMKLCGALGCRVSLPRELDKLRIRGRSVGPDPQDEGVLLIRVTFANMADHPQPYPVLQVQLSDVHGQLVAMRRFRPKEYLAEPVDATSPMPPDMPTRVRLRVVKPQTEVTNFEFEFL